MIRLNTAGATFEPHPLLRHPHCMTVFPRFWPRRGVLDGVPTTARLFSVAPQSQLLGHCHWQPHAHGHPTLILIHGLEGCSDSHYMRGIARKAWQAGLNVIRLNQRNCGGTEHLTPTLYHSGLSGDIGAVVVELSARDGLDRVWVAGYSMGGNLALKMAGGARAAPPAPRGGAGGGPHTPPCAGVGAVGRAPHLVEQRCFL